VHPRRRRPRPGRPSAADAPAEQRDGVVAGARARGLPRLVALVVTAFVAVEALLVGLGLLVTRVLDGTGLHREEVELVRAVPAARTPAWDVVTAWGTVLGSTGVVIAVTAAGCVLLLRRGHGPRLPAFLALAVAGETGLFLLAALVIDRDRPPIEQLDLAPPTSSFPSGHTAATLALACGLALGLARTRPGHRLIGAIWVFAVVSASFVTGTRLYRGMHWPTDLAASVVFVVVWLVLLRAILLPPRGEDRPERRPRGKDLRRE
jgi:membrane-associated phospholipid phosphatase